MCEVYREMVNVRSKPSIRHRAALLLLLPLLLGSATASPPPSGALPGRLFPGHSDRAALAYADAASAARRKDCAGAYKALAPVLAGRDSEAVFAQLLLGFYARPCAHPPCCGRRRWPGSGGTRGARSTWWAPPAARNCAATRPRSWRRSAGR